MKILIALILAVASVGCSRTCDVKFNIQTVLDKETRQVKRVDAKCHDTVIMTAPGVDRTETEEPTK